MNSKFFLLLYAFFAFVLSTATAHGATFTDTLHGNQLSSFWSPGMDGQGSVTPTTQGVLLSLDSTNSAGVFETRIVNNCTLSGNFDATFDYELVNWPTGNGMRLGLGVSPHLDVNSPIYLYTINPMAERVSGGGPVVPGTMEVYLTDFGGAISSLIETTDLQGKLRLVRTGNVITGYYYAAGAWVAISSAYTYTDDVKISGSVWGHNHTPGITARIDNFSFSADAITCGDVIQASIDIKPGGAPNPVNIRSNGVIPVAVFTTTDFDAADIDPSSVTFGPNKTPLSRAGANLEDVDGDGDLDMIFHFNTADTGIKCGDTQASLYGRTLSGRSITGSDSIVTRVCR